MSEKNSSTIKLDKNSELRRARRTKLFFVFILLILAILGGVVGFFRKKQFQISQVTVIGTKSLDPDAILQVAHHYLDGNYAIIIPKTNTLLLSKSDLAAYIIDQLPSISKVTVRFSEKNSIEISIIEKKPSYVWCNASCYFMDNTGMIYEPAPHFTDGVFTTFTGGTIAGDPIKQHFVSPEQFSNTLQVLASLDQLDIQVVNIDYGDNITIRIDSIKNIPVSNTSKIIVTKDGAVQPIIDALGLLLNDKTFLDNVTTKGSSLEYIDARFPDKIYYKFTTPVTQVVQPPTANAKLLDKTR